MADITIDGTSITGATIDGTDVKEITVDGTVVWTAAYSDSFTSFDTSVWTLFGSASYDSANNRVQLNTGAGSSSGRVEYDAGQSASSWTVDMTFSISNDGADEVDLNFQVSSYQNAYTPSDGFRVHYDHYNDNVALEEYNSGTQSVITSTPQSIGAGTHTGRITYNNGTVTVDFNGTQMFSTSISPNAASGFSVAGRDGGSTGAHYLEDITIDPA